MGFTLFRKIHTVRTTSYNRCVGYPNEFVEAAVLSPEGEQLPEFVVGMLGVKSETVTSGYWNQSALTYGSRLNGYWLTGDMVYRDAQGMFYHVDRIQDKLRTASGAIYTLPMEEAVLNSHPGVRDCAIFGIDGGDGYDRPAAVVLTASSHALTADEWLAHLNRELEVKGLARLAFLAITREREQFPVGPTGKILKRMLRERYRSALTAWKNVSLEDRALAYAFDLTEAGSPTAAAAE
jgi:acyl-CoA synthetase (AMP-forming)/AMP-acid ligase II